MGVGSSKRGRTGAVGRRHSWAVHDAPKSLYKSVSGSFKQLRCVMHGLQNKCRSENYLQQSGGGALVGLHSNWIGDFILASARPSDRLITEHHIIYQFHSQNIGAIINLQEPGEHAGCGDGVIFSTGFSYTPELFMHENIFYSNFPWKSSNFMDEKLALEICHSIDCQIAAGVKVEQGLSLHATYYILERMMFLWRPGALQSKHQVPLVIRFDSYLQKLRVQFVPPDKWRKRSDNGSTASYPSIAEIMVRQNKLLYGTERESLRFVPKVIDWLTRELIRRTNFERQKREQIAATFITTFTTHLNLPSEDELVQQTKRDLQEYNKVEKQVRVNAGDWSRVEELDTSVLCHLLLEWFHQLQEPIVPDTILTTALGRGDIESAVDELSKADKCSFATIQCLVCWMFQGESALAGNPHTARRQTVNRRHTINRMYNVYKSFKPSSLDVETGLLLEASARFWIKLGVAQHEEVQRNNKETVDTPGPPSSSSSEPLALKLKHRQHLGSFSQPWFRDRASLQYEQYKPGNLLEYQLDAVTGSIEAPSPPCINESMQEDKEKPIPHEEKIQQEERKLVTAPEKKKVKAAKKRPVQEI